MTYTKPTLINSIKEVTGTVEPHLQQQLGRSWLLWFKESNRYTILESGLKKVLDRFLESRNEEAFYARMHQEEGVEQLDLKVLYQDLTAFLSAAQEAPEKEIADAPAAAFNPDYCTRSEGYTMNGVSFRVHYQNEETLDLIHHIFAHYSEGSATQPQTAFWLYREGGFLYLFQDSVLVQAVNEQMDHYIRGKFLFRVISLVHGLSESDWICTLHASTVVSNESAIMLTGQSGRGKSTLTTLLVSGGFELLADDITPLHAGSLELFYNPSAVSIKKGAFPLVGQHFDTFESCPEVFINAFKGTVKYLPLPPPERLHYPCKAMVLVNYQEGAEAQLRPVEPSEVLQDLIPDSWVSPKPDHARAFMKWLDGLPFYQLTYSSPEGGIEAIRSLTAQP